MRLLRESPTLTSLLISFTRSISHLSLAVLELTAVLVTISSESAENGGDKNLGISDETWSAPINTSIKILTDEVL